MYECNNALETKWATDAKVKQSLKSTNQCI